MKYLYITYYFPPDLGAGSFRSKSLIENLIKKINKKDEIHIITTNQIDTIQKKAMKIKKIFLYIIKMLRHNEKFILKSLRV